MATRAIKQRTARCMGRNVAALLFALFATASPAQAAIESVAPISGGTVWYTSWKAGSFPSAVAACSSLSPGDCPVCGSLTYVGIQPNRAYPSYMDCMFFYNPGGGMPGWNTLSGTAIPYSNAVCPVPTVNPTVPYQYKASSGMCEREAPVATCPVTALTPLAPALQPYEDGLVDLENETQATRDGAACIVRSARAHRPRISAIIVSGYRPQAYQTHIREIYDKWQLLENNNDAECADIKNQIRAEFDHHGPFAHQPGNTSRHSTGRAVDISLTNYADADAIAAGCAMSRPVANDRSHFESPR